MMSDDEFDNLQDDFADLQDIDWNSILPCPPSTSQAIQNVNEREDDHDTHALDPTRPPSADSSNYSFDDIDVNFLEELSRVEEAITQAPQAGPSRVNTTAGDTLLSRRTSMGPSTIRSGSLQRVVQASPFFPNGVPREPQPVVPNPQSLKNPGKVNDNNVQPSHNISLKRPRSELSSPNAEYPHSLSKKGKMKANDDLERVLSTFEDEMTCPICCDLFVCAHVGNPCGHSFCGDCGWQWTTKNPRNGCPVCRASLTKSKPVIPNIAMDNMVERHISALAYNGNEDWKPGGNKHKEWISRKQKWKKEVAERVMSLRQQPRKKTVVRMYDIDDLGAWLVGDDEDPDDASYDEDEDNEDLIPAPLPRFRQHVYASNKAAAAPNASVVSKFELDAHLLLFSGFSIDDFDSDVDQVSTYSLTMHISFTPALGETLIVPKPFLPMVTVPIQFTAKLDAQDYYELKCNGGRIQLWSDIPTESRNLGEWGEFDLNSGEDESVGNLRTVVNLVASGKEQAHEHFKDSSVFLHLFSALPVKGHGYRSQFSFTYRIVYSSGEVKWLGQFGQNGLIKFDHEYSSVFGSILEDGWSENDTGNGRILTLSSKAFRSRKVMQLQTPSDNQIWAVGRDGFLPEATDASLIFLVPAAAKNSAIMGETYVFGASPGATLSVDSAGVFSASGNGILSIYTCDLRADPVDFMSRILTSHAPDILRLLACASSTVGKHVVLASSKENLPVKALVIPLGPIGLYSESQVTVHLATLRSALLDDNTQFSIYPPLTLDTHFVLDGLPSDADVSFIVGRSGGQVLLSPIYHLGETERDEKVAKNQCKVSILSTHTVGQPPSPDDSLALPTPPPSPRLRPIARLSSASNETAISSVSSLPEEVVASVTAIDGPAVAVDVPSAAADSPAAAMIIVRPRQRLGLLAYLKYHFVMAGLLLRMIYRLFFGSVRDVAESEYGDENNVDTHEKAKSVHLEELQNSTNVASEHSSILDPACEASISPLPDVFSSEQNTRPEQPLVLGEDFVVVSSHSEHRASNNSSQPLPYLSLPPSSLHAEVAAEASVIVAFIIHMSSGADGAKSQPTMDDVRNAITLNGQVPQGVVRKYYQTGSGDDNGMDHVYLLEFDGGRGGWIKISPIANEGQRVSEK